MRDLGEAAGKIIVGFLYLTWVRESGCWDDLNTDLEFGSNMESLTTHPMVQTLSRNLGKTGAYAYWFNKMDDGDYRAEINFEIGLWVAFDAWGGPCRDEKDKPPTRMNVKMLIDWYSKLN